LANALVIDDSRAMRSILRGILASEGFEVSEAEHGQAALDSIEVVGDPDVILVDWHMPEMSGIEFVRTYRQRPGCEDVLILIVSVESEMARIGEALAAGADEYLMKPFAREALIDKLALLGFYE
jgi:two-component system chemotaxis response regulator CheY